MSIKSLPAVPTPNWQAVPWGRVQAQRHFCNEKSVGTASFSGEIESSGHWTLSLCPQMHKCSTTKGLFS